MHESTPEEQIPKTETDIEQPKAVQQEYLGGELIGHFGRITIDLSKK